MNGFKTFPLVFLTDYLKKIEETAGKGNIKKFIMKAIEEKMLIENIDKSLHDKKGGNS